MTSKDLETRLKRRPFIPFRIHLGDGRCLNVANPSDAQLVPHMLAVRVPGNPKPDASERIEYCLLAHIVRVEKSATGRTSINKEILERIFSFHKLLERKNAAIAHSLRMAAVPLLEYRRSLTLASRDDLLNIEGIGPRTVDFLLRIIAGENEVTVLGDVPEPVKTPRLRKSRSPTVETGEWDGNWDNSVRKIEDG